MKTKIFIVSVLLFILAVPCFSQEVTLNVTDDGKLCAVFPSGAQKVLLNHITESFVRPVLCGNVVFYAKQKSGEDDSWVWGAVDLNGNRLNLIDKQEYGIAVDWEITGEPFFPEVVHNVLLIPRDAQGNVGVHWAVTDFTGKVLVPGDFCGQTYEEKMIALWEETGSGSRVCFYNTDTQKVVNELEGFSFNYMSGGYPGLSDGLLLLRSEGFHCGVVDKYGKTVIPFIYDDYYGYDFEKECYILCRGDVWYYVDKTGKEKVADF